MFKKFENKKLKVNSALRGHAEGSIIKVKVDKNNIPVDPYWRRRLNDAKVDGCVELVTGRKKKQAEDKV